MTKRLLSRSEWILLLAYTSVLCVSEKNNIDYCIYSFVSVTHIKIMIFFDVKIMQFFGVSPSEQY
jgi:hypothetical protein